MSADNPHNRTRGTAEPDNHDTDDRRRGGQDEVRSASPADTQRRRRAYRLKRGPLALRAPGFAPMSPADEDRVIEALAELFSALLPSAPVTPDGGA